MEKELLNNNTGGGYSLNKPERDSGIELFRIISMLLIVAHHYVVNSGILQALEANGYPFALNTVFLLVFGAWGKTGINCFVLITGWFMCKSKITLRKFLKLLLEVELYYIIIGCIFFFTGYESFTFKAFVKMILPITSVSTDFTGCYLLFFLTIPFLNILVSNMNQRQHLLLLALVGFIYVFLGTAPKITVTMNYVTWFIVLFFIGSYLRLYPVKFSDSKKFWGLLTLGFILVDIASVIIIYKVRPQSWAYFLSDSNKILALLTAICAFMFFKNIHFTCKFVNVVASATFGVLLIHANSDAMRSWLWGDLLKNVEYMNTQWVYLRATGFVLAVYIVCTLIDILRIYLLEKPLFKWLDKKAFDKRS